jgi:hypothetical protein
MTGESALEVRVESRPNFTINDILTQVKGSKTNLKLKRKVDHHP